MTLREIARVTHLHPRIVRQILDRAIRKLTSQVTNWAGCMTSGAEVARMQDRRLSIPTMIETTVPASPVEVPAPVRSMPLDSAPSEPDRREVNFQNYLSYCKRIGAKSATKEIYSTRSREFMLVTEKIKLPPKFDGETFDPPPSNPGMTFLQRFRVLQSGDRGMRAHIWVVEHGTGLLRSSIDAGATEMTATTTTTSAK